MHYFLYRFLVVPGIIGWLAAGSTIHAEDWYRFRGPRLDGVSSESIEPLAWPAEGPKIAWTAAVGTGFSSVSVSEGRLYTIGNAENVDTVVCLDAASGERIWKHSYESPTDANEFEGGPTSTPTVDEDVVFTLGRRGDLFCFDKLDGTVRWSINVADQADVRIPTWGFAGSPLVCGDALILNVGDAGVAIDKRSGESLWSSDDKDAGYSTPVPMETPQGKAVVIGSGRSYVCVDVATGQERWRQRWLTTFGCNAADAIIVDQQVLLSSGYNRGAALLDTNGQEASVIWKNKDLQNQLNSSVLLGGYVYGIHGNLANGAELRCLDWRTGEVQWSSDLVRFGGLAATEDQLILLSDSGELLLGPASPDGFQVTHRGPVLDGKCWTAPVLSNQRIYCRSAAGALACVELSRVQ